MVDQINSSNGGNAFNMPKSEGGLRASLRKKLEVLHVFGEKDTNKMGWSQTITNGTDKTSIFYTDKNFDGKITSDEITHSINEKYNKVYTEQGAKYILNSKTRTSYDNGQPTISTTFIDDNGDGVWDRQITINHRENTQSEKKCDEKGKPILGNDFEITH